MMYLLIHLATALWYHCIDESFTKWPNFFTELAEMLYCEKYHHQDMDRPTSWYKILFISHNSRLNYPFNKVRVYSHSAYQFSPELRGLKKFINVSSGTYQEPFQQALMLGNSLGLLGVREGDTQVRLCWPYLDLWERQHREALVKKKETNSQFNPPVLRGKMSLESLNKEKGNSKYRRQRFLFLLSRFWTLFVITPNLVIRAVNEKTKTLHLIMHVHSNYLFIYLNKTRLFVACYETKINK